MMVSEGAPTFLQVWVFAGWLINCWSCLSPRQVLLDGGITSAAFLGSSDTHLKWSVKSCTVTDVCHFSLACLRGAPLPQTVSWTVAETRRRIAFFLLEFSYIFIKLPYWKWIKKNSVFLLFRKHPKHVSKMCHSVVESPPSWAVEMLSSLFILFTTGTCYESEFK